MCLLPQVALPFHGRIAKELLEREPLLERHWPLKVLHLHVSANTDDIDPFAVLRNSEVLCVQQLVINIVACSTPWQSFCEPLCG